MTGPWLDPVRVALDAREAPVEVFFRDDDAGWGDDELLALLDVFDRRGVAIDLAVIPDALTRRLASQLLERRRDAGVRLHQHGRGHTNHETVGRKCEFGASRSPAELADDVVAGRDGLWALLGIAVDPVFTPPWNRCVDELGPILVDAGFTVLSRDRSAGTIGVPGLAEVAVCVDWLDRRHRGDGVEPRIVARALAVELAAALAGPGPVGVMLHHAVTPPGELALLDDLLGLLTAHPAARPTTIAALGRAVTPGTR